MNQYIKSILTGIIGLLLFALGAGLRLKAEALSTHSIPDAMLTADNGIKHMLNSTQMHAINDIALPLLWAGVALLVLSFGAWVIRPSDTAAR